MALTDYLKKEQLIIALVVGLFAAFAFWLRIIPLLSAGNTDLIRLVSMDDPFYNLRQTEYLLANFPQYGWFDAMTHYPYGTTIYWGPVFPTLIAVLCLATGSVTRPEIMGTALMVTPLIAAIIVVLMYFVGKAFGDWKTGVLASGFTAVITGQFFAYSMYGYIDHHIAEVLFSTLFCLAYSWAILSDKEKGIHLEDPASWKKTVALSGLAGAAYLLGLFTMPTMILFAMIVGIFTLVQFVIDVFRDRMSEYLLIINTTVFLMASVGLLLFGLKNPGIDLSTYSLGHVYAYLALIGGTVALYVLARALKGKSHWYYPVAIAGCGGIAIVILTSAIPNVSTMFTGGFMSFFGQQAVTNTVLEAMGWTPENAWSAYNYGLILFAGGALVMIYNNWNDEHPHQVFALVWSLVMLASTWQHIRYEYYLTVNVALLSAVWISFAIDRGIPALTPYIGTIAPKNASSGPDQQPRGTGGKRRSAKQDRKSSAARSGMKGLPAIVLVIAAVLVAALFCYTSATTSYAGVVNKGDSLIPDWRESLEWLGANTPDTGVGYLKVYDPTTFRYPPQSYGVMTWWDYGHMITYIAKRIPNANPFQQGVSGSDGAATVFVTTSEDEASRILDTLGTRYVITDTLMDTGKLPAMATWYNATLMESPYMQYMLVPRTDNPSLVEARLLYTDTYYHTMVSRLHNLDGSMARPSQLTYVEYADPAITGMSYPLIINAESMNATAARVRTESYNRNANSGYHATAISTTLLAPADTVPALRHFRLIHESPTNSLSSTSAQLKTVKTFEYVKGAHMKGEGIIELPLVTNTRRAFTYSQESVNGEFVVPYSTSGNPYDVRATGKYRIVGSGREFEVPESAVQEGLTIT